MRPFYPSQSADHGRGHPRKRGIVSEGPNPARMSTIPPPAATLEARTPARHYTPSEPVAIALAPIEGQDRALQGCDNCDI